MTTTEFGARLSADNEINRACQLQAKWNGTTVEEEYKKTMAYKADRKFNPGDVGADETFKSRVLEKHEAQACKYYNIHVLGKSNPCGSECNLDCENCLVKI